MPLRRRTAAAVIAAFSLALAGCGSDSSAEDSSTEESRPTESTSVGVSSGQEVAPGLPVPAADAWAAAGFSCEEFPAKAYPDSQMVQSCITATSEVAVMVNLVIADDRLVGWRYVGLPTAKTSVTTAQESMIATVLGIVSPDALAAVQQLGAAGKVETADWRYERKSDPSPTGGSSTEIVARNLTVVEAPSVRPMPQTFPVDLQALAAAGNAAGGECTVTESVSTSLLCDLGDYGIQISTDSEAEDHVTRFKFTTFASADRYPEQAAGLVEFVALAESPELTSLFAQVSETWATGEPTWTWIEGLPVLVIPMDSPSGFSVEANLIPAI